MTVDKHHTLIPDLPVRRVEEMGLKELERIRLILRGGSVIEWRRMHFNTWDEVDRFLRLQQIDPTKKHDEAWVRTVLADAVEYLRKTFNYRVADAVANPNMIHDLFLFASGHIDRRMRKIACIVLKTMHVIQHIEARDVLFHVAMPEAELSRMVTARVHAVMAEAREKGLPIVEFSDSTKTRESTITKLIAKKDSTAAAIYDRTRFRIIVKERDDVIPTLYFLNQRLLPFNFVVPTQSDNTLIKFKDLVKQYPNFEKYARQLHLDLDFEEREARNANTFSGATYRVLNFVADVPLRLDAFLPPPEEDLRERRCRISLATCEFQMVDEKTAEQNEKGENSHDRYKQRQRDVVLKRLSSGLVVPRRKPSAGG